MKTVTYRHNWSSNLNTEDEMASLFGVLLAYENTSEDYQEETSSLYLDKNGLYTWIDSSGCSCWDGDFEGWQCEKEELLKLAKEKVEHKSRHRDAAEDLIAQWIVDNLDE